MREINSKIKAENSVECGRPSKTDGPKRTWEIKKFRIFKIRTLKKKKLNIKLYFWIIVLW